MDRVYTYDITPVMDGQEAFLQGWVYEIRDMAKIKFLLLRDYKGMIQCVALKDSAVFDKIPKIPIESVVAIKGKVQKSDIAKKGVEIVIQDIEVLSEAQTLPITVTEKGITIDLSKRLDFRCLDLRKPYNAAIFKIQSAILEGFENQLREEDFTQVFTPCIMGAASESGAEVFKIKYYDTEAFLRQDPQLHRQLAILGGIEKLYDLGPSWRAEKSHTTQHLCEHRVIAAEMAFLKDEQDTMRLEERLIVAAIKNVLVRCKEEVDLLGIKLSVPKTPFPELRFPEVYKILEGMGKKLEQGMDLDSEANELLWKYVQKNFDCEFYFFNRFPFAAKPFYVMRVDEDPEWARSVDLNFRGIELSSGGQREHRYDKIVSQVKEKGISLESVEWFTKFFQWGAPPHGGFAMGIERFTQSLLNIDNIRRTVLFPRAQDRLLP